METTRGIRIANRKPPVRKPSHCSAIHDSVMAYGQDRGPKTQEFQLTRPTKGPRPNLTTSVSNIDTVAASHGNTLSTNRNQPKALLAMIASPFLKNHCAFFKQQGVTRRIAQQQFQRELKAIFPHKRRKRRCEPRAIAMITHPSHLTSHVHQSIMTPPTSIC